MEKTVFKRTDLVELELQKYWSTSVWTKCYEGVCLALAEWEKDNLVLEIGRREKDIQYTYGLPYTSSGMFASVGNTNTQSRLEGGFEGRDFYFHCLALDKDYNIVILLHDVEENYIYGIIGKVDLT